MKINWAQKLSSRKLWVLVAAFVTSVLVIFKFSEAEYTQIAALILNLGAVVAYIIAEGNVDAARAANPTVIFEAVQNENTEAES